MNQTNDAKLGYDVKLNEENKTETSHDITTNVVDSKVNFNTVTNDQAVIASGHQNVTNDVNAANSKAVGFVETAINVSNEVLAPLLNQSQIYDDAFARTNHNFSNKLDDGGYSEGIFHSEIGYDLINIMNPFVIVKDKIPTIVEVKVIKDDLLKGDSEAIAQMGPSIVSDFPQIERSRDLYGEGVVAVVLKLVTDVVGNSVADVNSLVHPNPYVNVTSVATGNVNLMTQVNLLSNRFDAFLKLSTSGDRIVKGNMIKYTQNINALNGEIANQIKAGCMWKGDNEHPYYAALTTNSKWLRDDLNQLAEMYPIEINEVGVESRHGVKISAIAKCMTDQYTAEYFRLGFEELKQNRMNYETLLSWASACTFKYDRVVISRPIIDASVWMYQPKMSELNAWMMYYIIDLKTRISVQKQYAQWLEGMRRLELIALPAPFGYSNMTTGNDAVTVRRELEAALKRGRNLDCNELLVLETLSGLLDVDFKINTIKATQAAYLNIIYVACWYIWFPRIAQRRTLQLQHLLMLSIQQVYSTQWQAWTKYWGWWGTFDSKDGRWIKSPAINQINDPALSQKGIQSSIFGVTGAVQNDPGRIFSRFREILMPQTHPAVLKRKREAGFPYFHKDYEYHYSWSEFPFANVSMQVETPESVRFRDLLTMLKDGVTSNMFHVSGPVTDISMNKTDSGMFSQLFTWIDQQSQSTGAAFNYTGRRIQDLIMNGPLTPFDGYKQEEPTIMPAVKVISPTAEGYRRQINRQAVPVPYARVEMNIDLAFSCVMRMQGEIMRPVDSGNMQNMTMMRDASQLYRSVGSLDPAEVLGKFYFLMKRARSFNKCMYLLKCIQTPNDNDNPIKEFAMMLSPYLKVGTFVNIAETIFSNYGLDWQDYLQLNMNSVAGVVDARMTNLAICNQNPFTYEAIRDVNDDDHNGVSFDDSDMYIRSIFDLSGKLTFNERSPFNRQSVGVVLGVFYAPELMPTVAHGLIEQYPITVRYEDLEFIYVPVKNANQQRMVFEGIQYTAYDRNMPRLRIIVSQMIKIAPDQRQFLARALRERFICIVMEDQRFVYDIDYSSDSVSISVDKDINELYNTFCDVGLGAVVSINFLSTEFGFNVNAQRRMNDGYVINLLPYHEIRGTDIMGGFYTEFMKPEVAKLPSGTQLGFGRMINGKNCFPGNMMKPKIDGHIINFNNALPYLTDKVSMVPPEIQVSYEGMTVYNDETIVM